MHPESFSSRFVTADRRRRRFKPKMFLRRFDLATQLLKIPRLDCPYPRPSPFPIAQRQLPFLSAQFDR